MIVITILCSNLKKFINSLHYFCKSLDTIKNSFALKNPKSKKHN